MDGCHWRVGHAASRFCPALCWWTETCRVLTVEGYGAAMRHTCALKSLGSHSAGLVCDSAGLVTW